MCLGIPMQIRRIDGNVAEAALSGTTRPVYLDILGEEVRVGDYVIVHAGFAIHKIDEREAGETLDLFREAGILDLDSGTDHGVH
ncbi:MAG: HypC/HybG/HupF family hydrogenase formation chaperone [Deltaproteobacteria bacterium]|nr:HypC/HybG/HupF family hydrogenase formation chaperone [Deltaproteobacteria bacterium]MBW2123365.1 HypC/HybG/HupF family hydrogenase formation chaperone [Deltaproteobacteria bacterium]